MVCAKVHRPENYKERFSAEAEEEMDAVEAVRLSTQETLCKDFPPTISSYIKITAAMVFAPPDEDPEADMARSITKIITERMHGHSVLDQCKVKEVSEQCFTDLRAIHGSAASNTAGTVVFSVRDNKLHLTLQTGFVVNPTGTDKLSINAQRLEDFHTRLINASELLPTHQPEPEKSMAGSDAAHNLNTVRTWLNNHPTTGCGYTEVSPEAFEVFSWLTDHIVTASKGDAGMTTLKVPTLQLNTTMATGIDLGSGPRQRHGKQ